MKASNLPDIRVLRNVAKSSIATIYKGRAVIIRGKQTVTLEGHEAHEKADFLTQTYAQLWDVTDSFLEDKRLANGEGVKNISHE